MTDKNYFDLTGENDLRDLSIQQKDRFDCQLIDKNGKIYDGFKLAQSKNGNVLTVCDIDFHISTDDKYQARFTFRKIDKNYETKTRNNQEIIIPFKRGQDGYREFWKMIVYLYAWLKENNSGEFEDYFSVTDKSLGEALTQISNVENKNIVLDNLKKISNSGLLNISNLVNATKIKSVLDEWEKNKSNNQEIQFWHPFFKKHHWIIPQVFSSNVTLFNDEFYVGGLSQGNRKGAKFVDFVVRNKLSRNISLVEIKTPQKPLISKNEYDKRSGIYSMSNELTGAISQVLNQKDEIQKDFRHDNQSKDYNVLNPGCILIIGSKENEQMNPKQEVCFELFKNSQKDIEIITFDELFERIKSILTIFEN